MRPTNKLFLFALITFLLFGTVPAVHAQDCTPITASTSIDSAQPVSCDVAPICYSSEITNPAKVYYYSIDGLVAGQVLTIDVDTDGLSSSLDSVLEVFDSDGNWLYISHDDPAPGEVDSLVDPYLAFTVPADGGGTYKLGISADGLGADTGPYTFFLECSDPPNSVEQVKVGDLLGAASGALVTINPASGASSLRFPLGIGPIADIEFDPSGNNLVLVAINGVPGRIIAIDPNSGLEVKSFSYESGAFWALESAGDTLYGVYSSDDGTDLYSLVTIDRETGIFDLVESFKPVETPIESLAYNSFNNALYGVSGNNLIQIDLESFTITPLGPMTFGNVVSLDFDPNNSLYGATLGGNQGEPGKLFEIDHATGTFNSEAGSLIFEDGSSADVTGLTFVVGVPQDVDPIKTICSSTLTTSASASSETAAPKLSRFKLKKNPLHRAIGLFKFEGMQGETVTINLTSEEEESLETVVEESSASELENSWLNHWKGKGRVFLGIRDSIPGLDYRERTKDHIPFSMSATLPENGTYYVMLIRPLLRFYKTDYCITLTSDMQEDSQAWETFDVAWPRDDSGDDTACTTAEESKDVQKDTETLAGASADDGSVSVTLSTTAIAPTSAPPEEITEEKTGDVPTEQVPPAENPREPEPAADEDGSEDAINDDSDANGDDQSDVGTSSTQGEDKDDTALTPTTAPPEEITDEKTSDVTTEEVPPAENPRDPEPTVEDGSEDTQSDESGGGDISEADDKESTEASTQ